MTALPPSFPKGLRVLLCDDETSLVVVEAQLRQPALQYAVTSCGSSTEALAYSRAAARAFDVVLAESKLVASDEVTGRAFVDAFGDVPVVLMSEGGDTDEVMRSVQLGAVDFLDKPLSLLRLKNIWQHSVRRMMQRTSLYDAAPPFVAAAAHPAYSEPVHHAGGQASLSGCMPSSMTAPMAPLAPPLPRAADKAPAGPNRSSVDSPGTPSAEVEPAESLSAGSVHQLGPEPADAWGAAGDGDSAAKGAPRAPLASKPSSFGALVPAPPTSQWPQLPAGCVWGTPAGGPLPPPLPSAAPKPAAGPAPCAADLLRGPGAGAAPVLVKARSTASLSDVSLAPSLAAAAAQAQAGEELPPSAPPLPAGFLSLDKAKTEAAAGGGPLGLKLRKSGSLLDLLNATLAAPGPASA